MKISIVIPSPSHHGRLKVLLDCLFSQDIPRGDYEVLIVSELPEADLKVFLKSHFGKFKNWKYFWSGRVGLSAVKNTAIDRAEGDWIWFLSETCYPKENQILKKILNRIGSDPEVGGLGGTLKNLRREDPLSQAWFKIRRQILHKAYYFDREGETRLIWPEHSLFKKSIFTTQLRFSEQLNEDSAQIELCQRITEKGHRLFLDPELELTHQSQIQFKDFATSAKNHAKYLVNKQQTDPEALSYLQPQIEFSPERRVRFFNAAYVYIYTRFLLSRKKLWVAYWILEDLKSLTMLFYSWLYRIDMTEGPRALSPSPRAYILDLNLMEHPNCAYCISLRPNQFGLGLTLDQQLGQAAFYNFEMLALPCSFFSEVVDFDILENILERGFTPLLRLRPQDFSQNRMKSLQALSYSGCRFEVLASQSFEDNQRLLEALREVQAEFDISFSLSYPSSLKQISRLPQWAIDRLQFLPNMENKGIPLSRMRKILVKLRSSVAREGKRILVHSPKVYELNEIKSSNLNPLGQSEFISRLDQAQLQVSVLIPIKKFTSEVALVLKSFTKQDFETNLFEVLFLQESHDPSTLQALKTWALESSKKLNIRLISSCQASTTRTSLTNLGAHFAEGSYLSFVNSGILLPPDYLHRISEGLRQHDLVQCPESFLSPEVATKLRYSSDLDFRHEPIKAHKSSDDFKKSKFWIHLKNHWMYTRCSSLSLKKDLFLKFGGFRTNLQNSDFEAIDLAYRMHKSGLRFYKAPAEVLHLSGADKMNDLDLIESSLSFYKNFPEDRVAQEFAEWLPTLGLPKSTFFKIQRQLLHCLKRIGLRFLGQDKDFNLSKTHELARIGK